MVMALPNLGSFSTSTAAATPSADDPSQKICKPYTISKSRESWTEPEHDKFLEALQLYLDVPDHFTLKQNASGTGGRLWETYNEIIVAFRESSMRNARFSVLTLF